MVNAYVLIETQIGKAGAVASRLTEIAQECYSGHILEVHLVTGPVDVIVKITHSDLDSLGDIVTKGIQKIDGVMRTNTCLAMKI